MKLHSMVALACSSLIFSACNSETTLSVLPPPSVNFSQMPTQVKGNSSLDVHFTVQAADGNYISSVEFDYAADGVNFQSVAILPGTATDYVWSVPGADLTTAKIKVIGKDNRGFQNSSVSSVFSIISTGPKITLDSAPQVVNKLNTASFNGHCQVGTPIQYYGGLFPGVSAAMLAQYQSVTAPVCQSNGTWSLPITNSTTDGTFSYTLSQSDIVGNMTSVSFVWIRDTAKPIIITDQSDAAHARLFASLTLQEILNQTQTPYNHDYVTFTANDSLSKVVSYCVSWTITSTSPTDTDPCWKPISAPALQVSVAAADNATVMLGFIAGRSYGVKIWVKNALATVSDPALITAIYQPSRYPLVSNVTATNSNQKHALSPDPVELTATAGQPVYIYWSAQDPDDNASDANYNPALGLKAAPMNISVSNNQVDFFSIGANLNNAANGGCTLPAGFTGCLVWNAANTGTFTLAQPFRIRITATDKTEQASSNSSSVFNLFSPTSTTPLARFTAGNLDDGLSGAARTAMYFPLSASVNVNSFVITSDGSLIINDARGLLIARAQDGLLKPLIKVASSMATNIPDGSLYASGAPQTTHYVGKMILDASENIIYWDSSGVRRIRNYKYTTDSPTIDTIVGCATLGTNCKINTDATLVGVAVPGNQIHLQNYPGNSTSYQYSLSSIPDGRITLGVYGTPTLFRMHIYNPADGTVTTLKPAGTGVNISNTAIYTTNPASEDLATTTDLTVQQVFPRFSTVAGATVITGYFGNVQQYPATVNGAAGAWGTVNMDANMQVIASPQFPASSPNRLTTIDRSTGTMYQVGRSVPAGYITLLNENSTTTALAWSGVLNNSVQGDCPDGTLVSQCAMDLSDVFVDNGQVYLFDGSQIRVVDDTNKIQTIYGQSLHSGDGGNPMNARIGIISALDRGANGTIGLLDYSSRRFREFNSTTGDASILQTVAGNGLDQQPAAGANALTSGVGVYPVNTAWTDFAYDPANSNIYYYVAGSATAVGASPAYRNTLVGYLDRSTGLWTSKVVPATNSSAIFTTGSSQNGRILGVAANSQVLYSTLLNNNAPYPASHYVDSFLFTGDASTLATSSTKFLGTPGNYGSTGVCTDTNGVNLADGSALVGTCTTVNNNIVAVDDLAVRNRWLFAKTATNLIRTGNPAGTGGVQTLATLANTLSSFTYEPDASGTPTLGNVYYCSYAGGTLDSTAFTAGSVIKRTLATGVEHLMMVANANTQCSGRRMLFSTRTRNGVAERVLTVSYQSNSGQLSGVMEFINP